MISVNRSGGANYHALSSLRRIDKDIAENQTRVATGLKVRSAADDATAFAAATSIRSDLKATEAIKSDLAVAQGRAEATLKALDRITGALKAIQQLLTEAYIGDPENGRRNSQISGYQSQIKGLVSSVSVKGVNWLTSDAATVATIKLDAETSITFVPTRILAANGGAGTLWNVNASRSPINLSIDTIGSSFGPTFLTNSRTAIEAAIASVAFYATQLNGLAGTLSSQSDLLDRMDDVRKSALGNLVDADLSEESARSRALQARQQLAYQALSIGNSKPSNILALFR